MISYEGALAAARSFAGEVRRECPDVTAVVLIGSLATGEYVPGRSDIDTFVLVRDGAPPEIQAFIRTIADRYQRDYEVPKGFGAEYAELSQLLPPYDPEEGLAPEILRLSQQGRVLDGDFDLATVPVPSEDHLRAYCRVFIPWLREERRSSDRDLLNKTVDTSINGLLYELRLAVLSLTGRYVLSKRQVVPELLRADPGTNLADRLEIVHDYEIGRHAEPALNWVDVLRDDIESYVSRVANWAFSPEG